MGNIINFADKCMRCGNENMFKDYDYRTGEGAYSCNACGMVRSAFIKRDITGSTITTDVEYPIDGNLVMAVRAYHPYIWGKDNAQLYNNLPEEGTILWEKPITSEMNLDDINEFMSPKTEKI